MAKARRGRKRPDARSPVPSGAGRQHWRADGQPKTRFPSRDEANRSALRLRLEVAADLDPYECEFCGGWHLGNRRQD
ncbi:MAG TPA: hypothetical protein VIC86_10730 [Acidimicrobiales bacterium]|jgi:hypothetical protein